MNVATINLKLFFPRQFIFQVHSHFSRIFNKIIKFQYFSRTGKTVVIFPGFPGAVGILGVIFTIDVPISQPYTALPAKYICHLMCICILQFSLHYINYRWSRKFVYSPLCFHYKCIVIHSTVSHLVRVKDQ